jgi:hypothetical protein
MQSSGMTGGNDMQFKRLVALLALAAGSVGILVCIVGAFAAWSLGARLERTNAAFFATIDKGLVAAQDRAHSLQERVEESKITSAEIDQRFRDWDTRKTKEALVSRVDIEGRAEKLSSHLETAESWLEKVADSIQSVQQIMELGNTIGATVDPATVQEVLTNILSVRNTLQETERKVAEIRKFAINQANESEEARVSRVTKLTGRVLLTIGEIDTRLEDSVIRLAELQTRARQSKTQISAYILVTTVACFLLLVWIAAGQAALCQWGWSNRKRPKAGSISEPEA